MPDPFALTVKAVAERYDVGTDAVYRWIHDKHLTALRLPGGDYRVCPDDLAIFERRCRDQDSSDRNTGSGNGGGSGPSPGPTPEVDEPGPFRRGQKIAAKPKFGVISG